MSLLIHLKNITEPLLRVRNSPRIEFYDMKMNEIRLLTLYYSPSAGEEKHTNK